MIYRNNLLFIFKELKLANNILNGMASLQHSSFEVFVHNL